MLPARAALLCLPLLAACGSPLYHAPGMHLPLFEQPGEVSVAGAFGTTGLEAQGALALPFHLAVVSAASLKETEQHSHSYGELGLGTYFAHSKLRLEGFVGAGAGRAAAHRGEALPEVALSESGLYGHTARANYQRAFAQATFAFSEEHFEGGVSWQGALLRYRLSRGEAIDPDCECTVDLPRRQDYRVSEVIGFARVGSENLKAELQGGLVLEGHGRAEPDPWPFHFTLGVRGNFQLPWEL